MKAREFLNVDPSLLHLPPSRSSGADPGKLHRQIATYGASSAGMPPLIVFRGSDGALMIFDGVTRATCVAKLAPGMHVRVEVIGHLSRPCGRLPTVGGMLP